MLFDKLCSMKVQNQFTSEGYDAYKHDLIFCFVPKLFPDRASLWNRFQTFGKGVYRLGETIFSLI